MSETQLPLAQANEARKILYGLRQAPEPFVAMGIGVPGSGKSTILSVVAHDLSVTRVCPDDIRKELTGDASNQTSNAVVWGLAYQRTQEQIRSGCSVIFDATHVEASRRKEAIALYRAAGAVSIVGVLFDVQAEIAKQRNASRERVVPDYVIERMATQLQQNPPSLAEGFDNILTFAS